jgi:hypothetical protein
VVFAVDQTHLTDLAPVVSLHFGEELVNRIITSNPELTMCEGFEKVN